MFNVIAVVSCFVVVGIGLVIGSAIGNVLADVVLKAINKNKLHLIVD